MGEWCRNPLTDSCDTYLGGRLETGCNGKVETEIGHFVCPVLVDTETQVAMTSSQPLTKSVETFLEKLSKDGEE